MNTTLTPEERSGRQAFWEQLKQRAPQIYGRDFRDILTEK
jgi:hypothetical protein